MKANRFLYASGMLAGLLLASCSNDEGEQLAYPLQIGSATVSADETATRVYETEDGMKSRWDDGDKISVRIGDDGMTGAYTLNADGTVKTADTPVYWQSKAAQTVTAWYPASDGTIDLSDQTEGLKYVLKATAEKQKYSDAVSLDFKQQLAKVRVKLTGDKAADVTAVAVKGMTSFSVKQGAVGEAVNEGYIKMMKASYTDGEYYEANLVPQTISADDFVQITMDGKAYICTMDCNTTVLKTGNAYTFTVETRIGQLYADSKTHTIYTTEEGQITAQPDIIIAALDGTGKLKVEGKINQDDLNTIIEVCRENKITNLDLSGATGIDLNMPNNAFKGYESLTSIAFPEGLVSIGKEAFWGCTNLTNPLVIPDGVTIIEYGAFCNCTSLNTVDLPSTLITIENAAFYSCTNLETIVIPASVKSIEGERQHPVTMYMGAFGRCTNLKTVTFSEGITNIGHNAFYKCTSLTSVSIPESVESIGIFAFYGCTSLASVSLPKQLANIDVYAFTDCTGLKDPLYNDVVFVYYHSDNNVDYSIPYGINTICGGALYGFTGLQSINIPETVKSIGDGAFYGCSSLTSVYIPQFVNSIGWGAFYGCANLTEVSLPESIESLESTFSSCTKLETVTFYDGVGYWDDIKELNNTFSYCTSLTSVNIPESVTTLSGTFNTCTGLISLTIPQNVTSIGDYTFSNCTNLSSITMYPTEPPSVSDCSFDINKPSILYVIEVAYDTYKTADTWKDFSTIQPISE